MATRRDQTGSDRGGHSLARRMLRLGAASVLVVAAILGLTGCGAEDPSPVEHFMAQARSSQASTPDLVLPAALPPNLVEGSVSTHDGIPTVWFYSANQPIVTVCPASEETCARLSNDVVFRVTEHEGKPVVISLGRTDDPAAAPPSLQGEYATFWRDVDFSGDVPAWLAAS